MKGVAAADVMLAIGMAVLAGATDVYGLAALGDLFVSFMSGNTTLLGKALATGGESRVVTIALLIGCFTAGAAFGAVLETLAGRRHAALVLVCVTLMLLVPLAWPGTEAVVLTAAMGTLNAAMTRLGEASISLTYVTGTLVRFGQGLGRALCGRRAGWGFLWQAPMWLSLLAGAVLGASAQRWAGPSPWPLPGLAALISLVAVLRLHFGGRIA